MNWIVKDTSKLKDYGFSLERPYEENDAYTEWNYTVRWGLDEFFISVPETDVGEDGSPVEAVHSIYLDRGSGFSIGLEWGVFLPKLVELYTNGLLEWGENEQE